MTPQKRAAMLRFQAARLELASARLRADAALLIAADSIRKFGKAWAECESRELQSHPDIAELDAQLDGFYA